MARSMKKGSALVLFSTLLLFGCHPPKPVPWATTFSVWDAGLGSRTTFQLMPPGRALLRETLAREPDLDLSAPISLKPSGLLIQDGKSYALEADELILFGDEGSKIWKRKGIRADLIRASSRLDR